MQTFQKRQQRLLSRLADMHEQTCERRRYRPWAAGLLGAMALGVLYLAIAVLAGSWQQAVALLRQDAAFIVPFLLVFGIQVGVAVASQRRRC
jgi:hypothetical protein